MDDISLPFNPCIIVHGGAGNVPFSCRSSSLCAVKEAVRTGYQVLLKSGSAVDAVEAATRSMEDSGVLNAGCGSYLTEDGNVELDAMIMDGKTLNTGAVACMQNIANPISVARKVMTDTPHCMLVGEGALKFARKMGFPIVEDPRTLISDRSYQKYMKEKLEHQEKLKVVTTASRNPATKNVANENNLVAFPEKHDTVGAVAIDSNGHIAASSSTGGISYKMSGRVGDSPLVGSGSYANRLGGASCTGHGESLLKVVLSREVVHCIENGDLPSEACRKSITKMAQLTGGVGGVICLGKFGMAGLAFNSMHMVWASVTEGTLKYGIDPGEEIEEQV